MAFNYSIPIFFVNSLNKSSNDKVKVYHVGLSQFYKKIK